MTTEETERTSWSLDDLRAERNAAGEPLVLRELRDDGILLVTLNRPERGNAWEADMEVGFYDAMDHAVENPDVRVVVVTGAGKIFCPGMDLGRLQRSANKDEVYRLARRPQTFLMTVPKPVICAINGSVAGIGFIQAMMADVRITSRSAKWTSPFARLGLPGEDALPWRVQRVAGVGVASDILLSARIFDGEEAVRLGLATAAYDPAEVLPRTLEYAAEMAKQSPMAMAMIKQQLLADAQQSVEAARVRARYFLKRAKQHSDFGEGVRAFSEKRPTRFAGIGAEIGYLDDRPDFVAADLEGAG